MATLSAAVALAAAPALACATIAQRITITPGTVQTGSLGIHGPLTNDSYVMVPGLIDGIYDT